MAVEEAEVETKQVQEEAKLKYLGFFQIAVLRAAVCLSSLYKYAKENAGPLKPGVDTVEQTVKTVVDDTIGKVDEFVPPTLKQRTCEVYDMAKQVPDVARSVISEIHRSGIIETASETARSLYTKSVKDLYTKHEPVAQEWVLFAYHKLLQLPLLPQLVHILIPTATYWTDKYNHTVVYLADRHYRLADFLPLVPVERIRKLLERDLEETKKAEIHTVS